MRHRLVVKVPLGREVLHAADRGLLDCCEQLRGIEEAPLRPLAVVTTGDYFD